MKLSSDAWLSGIFGYDVIRVAFEKDEPIDPKLTFLRDPLPAQAFFYAKIPVASVAQVGALTGAGFRVVDVNVTFEREPASIASNDETVIRDVKPEDEEDVLSIAESAFEYSRFHLDPFLSKQLADKIKREWIANYIRRQRGERLLVAEVNGKAVGFLALLVTDEAEKVGVIDLIGVARGMRGRGIGRRLVEYHVDDACGKYAHLLVGTQIANVPSIRLYLKCGYTFSSSTYVLHAHVSGGRIV